LTSKFLTDDWHGVDSEFVDAVPVLETAVKFAFKSGKMEEKLAALQALRLLVLMDPSAFQFQGFLERMVGELSSLTVLALEVLALTLWLNNTAGAALDKTLELCESVKGSQRAFALLASLKSDDDVADVVLPSASWLVDRFVRAEGTEKVELGWTICGLFCGLHDARKGSYDPFEVDGFVNVGEFSDACRNVKALREVAEMLDSGMMPSEQLVFNSQKVVFEGE
jgi:hypothetical protein